MQVVPVPRPCQPYTRCILWVEHALAAVHPCLVGCSDPSWLSAQTLPFGWDLGCGVIGRAESEMQRTGFRSDHFRSFQIPDDYQIMHLNVAEEPTPHDQGPVRNW